MDQDPLYGGILPLLHLGSLALRGLLGSHLPHPLASLCSFHLPQLLISYVRPYRPGLFPFYSMLDPLDLVQGGS